MNQTVNNFKEPDIMIIRRKLKCMERTFAGMLFAVLFGGYDSPDIMWYSFAAILILTIAAFIYMASTMGASLRKCFQESIKEKTGIISAIFFFGILALAYFIKDIEIRHIISTISFLFAIITLFIGMARPAKP